MLRGLTITHPDQVWSTDITYVPLTTGFMYLVAIIDWYSRYVLTWRLSNTLDGAFCLSALDQALASGQPEIFNTDQGAQFTAQAFIERLWRTVKYEDIYLKDYEALYSGLGYYFRFYNEECPHQSLGYCTPAEVYARQATII